MRRFAAVVVGAIALTAVAIPASAGAAAKQPKMLALTDFPTGWSVTTASSDLNRCSRPTPIYQSDHLETAFAQGIVPVVDEILASPKSATKGFDQTVALYKSCSSFSDNGTAETISALSYPRIGDQSAGFTVRASVFTGDIVVFRKGALLGQVVMVGDGAVDLSQFEKLTSIAVSGAVGKIPAGAGLDESAASTSPTIANPSADVVKGWAAKWCQAQPGISKAALITIMGKPTDDDAEQSSWDGFEWQFDAFYDTSGNVRQLDINDNELTTADKAAITCEMDRFAP